MSFFEGHFDEQPVLPGVAQIFIVKWLVEDLFQMSEVRSMSRIKFNKIIFPDTAVKLILKKKGENVSFTYKADSQIHSSGTLSYGK